MRLYPGQFDIIAEKVIRALLDAEVVEIEEGMLEEAQLDIVGVLKEYNRMDRTLTRRAKDMAAGEGRSVENKLKRRMAREKNFKYGDEGLDYVVNQMIELLIQSQHIDEIYGTDRELRAKINPVMKRMTASRDDELDVEVRSKLKNLEQGSAAFDIEYQRVMERVQRNKGLSDGKE